MNINSGRQEKQAEMDAEEEILRNDYVKKSCTLL